MDDNARRDPAPASRYDRVPVGIAIAVIIGVVLLALIMAWPMPGDNVSRMLAMFGLGLFQLPFVGIATIVAFVKGWRSLGAGLIIGASLMFLLGPAVCFGYAAQNPINLYPYTPGSAPGAPPIVRPTPVR
jgi:hypothetical protein